MRLSPATLGRLPAAIERPRYDRTRIGRGVVHVGLGAFSRAHQAPVFERALAAGDHRWGITGASLRSRQVHDALAPQDGLYTLLVRDRDGERAQVIGAVGEVLVAPDRPAALVARLARPTTHLVTLTITEKGYHLGPDGALLAGNTDVAADLASLDRPRTAAGLLVAALARRRAAGIRPFTAISCDNLPGNGRRLAMAVIEMASAHDPGLARWIETEAAFPATMVDRIVPATNTDMVADFAAASGVEDRGLVTTEPFLQWVIEDRFCSPRPDFAALGVELAGEVAPWEDAKLRLLNGAHSALAYLGALAGLTRVDEAVAIPAWRRLVERLWDEAAATLSPPPGLDLAAYRTALMARFDNPALAHRLRQIAADGSQKLPQRLLAPLRQRSERGLASPALALAVAGWMRWQVGRTDAGEAVAIDDPLAPALARAQASGGDARGRAAALLAVIAPCEPLDDQVARALVTLQRHGACAAVDGFSA